MTSLSNDSSSELGCAHQHRRIPKNWEILKNLIRKSQFYLFQCSIDTEHFFPRANSFVSVAIHAAIFNHHSTFYGPEIIYLDVIDLNCSSIQIITSSQIPIKSSVTRLSLCFCGKFCFYHIYLFLYHRKFASYFVQKNK